VAERKKGKGARGKTLHLLLTSTKARTIHTSSRFFDKRLKTTRFEYLSIVLSCVPMGMRREGRIPGLAVVDLVLSRIFGWKANDTSTSVTRVV
jgi:hypothetical protein